MVAITGAALSNGIFLTWEIETIFTIRELSQDYFAPIEIELPGTYRLHLSVIEGIKLHFMFRI